MTKREILVVEAQNKGTAESPDWRAFLYWRHVPTDKVYEVRGYSTVSELDARFDALDRPLKRKNSEYFCDYKEFKMN
jgi:hypothetical protein